MEQPGPQARPRPRSHQLVLPFATAERGHRPPPLPVATVSTRQVWASLGPTGQEQLHQLLLRIVREVACERSA
ncbi:MAG: hypothetical protein M3Q65_06740 [Chloroflexota bacterium]|nr:hypothetical protein [Chloroflexota bacterium]